MSQEQIDIATAINSAMRSVRSQLESAEQLATGSARNVISSLLSEHGLLNIHSHSMLEAVNAEADEYNELVGLLEDRDSQLAYLEGKVNDLQQQLESAELDKGEAEAKAMEFESAIKISSARLTQQQQEQREQAKEYYKLAKTLKEARARMGDIEKLKKRDRELKAQLEELRKANATQRAEITKHRKEKAKIVSDLADAGDKNNYLQEQIKDLGERLTFNDGDVSDDVFEGENGVMFYLYTFGFGIKCQEADRELITPVWHMELRTNTGHCVLVMVDENLAPVIPTSVGMGIPPQGVVDLMKSQILKRCEKEFPELWERRQWSESTSIIELGLTNGAEGKLRAAGINTVFDILTHPERALVKLPGIGSATAKQARDMAHAAVATWEKERATQLRLADKNAA